MNPKVKDNSSEEIQQVRRRPGMYFGKLGSPSIEKFVYELVANVLDLYLINQATFVNVELNGTVIYVEDDGLGLPFDEPSNLEGISLATKLLTHIHWTRSHDEHAPHVHIGGHGLGLAPLNATSIQLIVRSWRSGSLWEQRFSKGFAQSTANIIERGNGCGTKIEVIPDPEIFGQAQPRSHILRRTLFETAHLFAGFRIGFQEERFHAPKGLQMLGFMLLNPSSLHTDADKVQFHLAVNHENVFIEVAVFGNDRSRTRSRKCIFSWVNGVRTIDGGSHVEGLVEALKEVKWNPTLSLIHVVMYDPEFAGPTRDRLDVPHIQEMIQKALLEPLLQYRTSF